MQTRLENISVAGMNVALAELQRKELKGAIVDDIARFKFYRAAVAGNEFVLLVSKVGINETPANCAKIAGRLSSGLNLPIVFYFPTLKFYERWKYRSLLTPAAKISLTPENSFNLTLPLL